MAYCCAVDGVYCCQVVEEITIFNHTQPRCLTNYSEPLCFSGIYSLLYFLSGDLNPQRRRSAATAASIFLYIYLFNS